MDAERIAWVAEQITEMFDLPEDEQAFFLAAWDTAAELATIKAELPGLPACGEKNKMGTIEQLTIFHKATWRDQPESYWLSRLVEEIGELAQALNGRHDHPPELELAEIASICANWIQARAVWRETRADHAAHREECNRRGVDRPQPY